MNQKTFRRVATRALVACVVLLSVGCGASRKVQRIAVGTQTDLSGRWNDTDARVTSEAMIDQCFKAAWLGNFREEKGHKPAVRVRRIVNKTDEHIDAQVFIKNIERAMINSGRVRVLAQEGAELGAIEREQDHSVSGRQSDDTPVSLGNEAGADMVVVVRMSSILDQLDNQRAKFYKLNFELIDATTGEKAWIGDHEIKKLITQKRGSW